MTESRRITDHDDDLSRRLIHTENEVGELKTGQARLEARLETGLSSISSQLERLSAPKPGINLVGWVSALIAGLVLLGAIGAMALDPIRSNVGELNRQSELRMVRAIDEHKIAIDHAYKTGKMEAQLEGLLFKARQEVYKDGIIK